MYVFVCGVRLNQGVQARLVQDDSDDEGATDQDVVVFEFDKMSVQQLPLQTETAAAAPMTEAQSGDPSLEAATLAAVAAETATAEAIAAASGGPVGCNRLDDERKFEL